MSAAESLQVDDDGATIAFTFADLMRYHGPHSPAGVAMAFKAMQRAFGALSPGSPVPRRAVVVRTAFRGPGARDGFEAVTRGVTEDRYTVDRSLVRPDRGRLLEDFVFQVAVGDRAVTLLLRDGFVTGEFLDLARASGRNAAQEQRLVELKAALAQRVMAASAADVFTLS